MNSKKIQQVGNMIETFIPYFVDGMADEFRKKTGKKKSPTYTEFVSTYGQKGINEMVLQACRPYIDYVNKDKGNKLTYVQHIEKHKEQYDLLTQIVQHIFEIWGDVETFEELVEELKK